MDTSPLRTPLAERIRTERIRCGLTQEQAARSAGILLNTYQRAELGRTEPRIVTLRALASLFGVTLDELIGDDGPANGDTEAA